MWVSWYQNKCFWQRFTSKSKYVKVKKHAITKNHFSPYILFTSASKIRPTKNSEKNHDDFNRINKKLLKTFDFWRPVFVEILFFVSSLNCEAWKRIVKSIFLSIIKFMQQFGCTTLNSNAERARNLENPFTYTLYNVHTKYLVFLIFHTIDYIALSNIHA